MVIKVENRLAYYEALDKAHTTQEYDDFIQLVVAEVNNSLDLYLSAMN
ncbi:hypothetical protein LAV73_21955 [Lysinibacillus xylanilyticus]|nr:hypothetical protein [Lysinibacillus xylanilyticus]MEB2282595.1 hypothetical protein [Lysinibacillus xylanilyticus]